MSGKPSGANSVRQPGAPTETTTDSRPAYRSPKLVRFGTLMELTQSGSGSVGESAVAKTRKPRPQS
jgi:hypothetical protein